MRVLVTGGAGFIGSAIVEELLHRGHDVRVLDDFSTASRTRIKPLIPDIELIPGDITSFATVRKAVSGVDSIIHQAALSSVARSLRTPARTHAVNVTGTVNLLVAGKDRDCSRFLLASSSSVYGALDSKALCECNPVAPMSPYAASKLAAEAYAMAFHASFALDVVCLRYFNVYGPGQRMAGSFLNFIPSTLSRMARDEAPVIFSQVGGSGVTARRPFTRLVVLPPPLGPHRPGP